jgi:competence protein ComEA
MKMLRTAIAFFLLSVGSLTALASPVNINTADELTLSQEINGVGPKLAKSIVEFREQNGAFATIDDLQRVKGIGPKLVDRNKANMTVEESAEPTTSIAE